MNTYLTSNIFITQICVFSCILLLACQNEPKSLSSVGSNQSQQSTQQHSNHEQANHTTQNEDESSKTSTPKAIEDATTTFSFVTLSHQNKHRTIQINYHRRTHQAGARSAELFLEYPKHLQIKQYLPLDAIQKANKELIIQAKEPGVSRILIYGINMNELASGPLFQVTFNTADTMSGLLHVREQFPLFAPASANEGVVFPKPYSLEHK